MHASRPQRAALGWLLLLCVGAVLAPAPARAGLEHPPFGGPGGGPFRSECPPWSYVVGLAGGMGAWLDSIQPLCAPLQPLEQRIGPGTPAGQRAGGSGGAPFSLACPVGYALGRWRFDMVVNSDIEWTFVNALQLECRLVGSPGQTYSAQVGDYGAPLSMDVAVIAQMGVDRPGADHACLPGELATGIHGRAGAYVDALGLICGAPPTAQDAATCNAYRDSALQAAAESRSLGCGHDGARWSGDANMHLGWCMGLGADRAAATQSETAARASELEACKIARLGVRERAPSDVLAVQPPPAVQQPLPADAVVAPPDVGVKMRKPSGSMVTQPD
jgi:hypothetical protein